MADPGETTGSDEAQVDNASDERRLFGEKRDTSVGFVASEMGVLRLRLAGDRIGEFGLVERCTATSIAASGEAVAVGTEEDVLLVGSNGTFKRTDFGPAVAVGIDETAVFAAGPDGRVGTLALEQTQSEPLPEWELLGEVSSPQQFDGALLAAESGVFRLSSTLESLGLEDAVDVAVERRRGREAILAATADGLYRRDGDWQQIFDTPVRRVSADDELFVVTEEGALLRCEASKWEGVSLPNDRTVVDVVADESVYVVTETGEFLIAAHPAATSDGFEGWRTQPLGVRGIVGFALLNR